MPRPTDPTAPPARERTRPEQEATGQGRRVSPQGERTRTRILDATERLFSLRGYEGTSLRDIAASADVRLGLVHYHFGTKDQILAATLERKVFALRDEIQASFDAARETARNRGEEFSLELSVRAFILPFLHIGAQADHPLRDFVVMTSHLMSSYRIPEVKPSLARLAMISRIFTDALREVMPGTGEEDLLTGTYLIEAALIFMVQDPGFLDDISDNRHSAARLQDIAERTLTFFTAGLRALAANPASRD